MTRTVVPEAMGNGERFKVNGTEGKEWLPKGKGRMDDGWKATMGILDSI